MLDSAEKERRKKYNEAAVAAAGEYHAQRYRGLIAGAEMPPALAAGGRIGMIGIADDIRERIPVDKRYSPRTLVPMVGDVDVALPGEERVRNQHLRPAPVRPSVPETTADLNELL